MGKNVGILSMQKVLNYGSFLQAYALKQILLRNGADEVYFIDIKKGKALPGYKQMLFSRIKSVVKVFLKGDLLKKIEGHYFMKKVYASIESNFYFLEMDKQHNVLDVVVIGSDEVFNCCQVSSWGYTLQLYGDIPNAQKIISYAGSFGHTSFEQLIELGIDKEIGDTMKKMSAISVRDKHSFNIVEKIVGIVPQQHLDPVLIYGYRDEIQKGRISYPYKYMVVYTYHGRIKNKSEVQAIVNFAKSKKLKLVSIFCTYSWCDEAVIPTTPFDVLAWFKEADYVITDTFHGTIFSIITKSQFCVLIRDSNKEKLSSLLIQMNLTNRIAETPKLIKQVYDRFIEYSQVDQILESERMKTSTYFASNI